MKRFFLIVLISVCFGAGLKAELASSQEIESLRNLSGRTLLRMCEIGDARCEAYIAGVNAAFVRTALGEAVETQSLPIPEEVIQNLMGYCMPFDADDWLEQTIIGMKEYATKDEAQLDYLATSLLWHALNETFPCE
jgi:hypothetical protein